MLNLRLRPTNGRLRWVVGLGLLALICIQCASPTSAVNEEQLVTGVNGKLVGKLSAPMANRLERLAREDHIALLEWCKENYLSTVQDYTCTFIKRENINGKVDAAQVIDVKFRERPFSVAMVWLENAPIGDRCLYVEGEHDNQMLVRPKGMLSFVGTQRRGPESPEVMANTLRPITLFGFGRGLDSLIDVYQVAAERGELDQRFAGYKMVDGRETIVLERLLPPSDDYPAWRTLTYIDVQTLLPVCIEAWDWNEQLDSRYIYTDLRLNVGLTAGDFEPTACGM